MGKVVIGIPVKNSGRWLPKFFKAFDKLTYPKEDMRVVFIVGESTDNTLELIQIFKEQSGVRVNVYKEQSNNDMRIGGIQLGAEVYKDFQHLIEDDDDYWMLMDCDLVDFPEDLIQQLIDVDADIVAPYPWSENHRHFYDNFIFRVDNFRFSPQHPPGEGQKHPVIVDSVGTCFLTKKEVFVSVPIQNPYPNLTFCNNARARGFTVVACPYIEVIHTDMEKLGIYHNPLPQEWGGYPKNGFIDNTFRLKPYTKKKIIGDMAKESEDVANFIRNMRRPT